MRRIVLDTETTGLEPGEGHRIIELAGLEMTDRRPTGRHFHRFLNPERAIDIAATQVHGMTAEDLADKPRFADIAEEFLEFVAGAELLIHNAPFDVAFLNAELTRIGRPAIDSVCTVTDTLMLARETHPGKKNSLDALCERYFVNNANRTLHGALLDARLLGECYLAMTRGQESLVMELEAPGAAALAALNLDVSKLLVVRASPEEAAAHEAYLQRMEKDAKGPTLWRRILGMA